MLFFSSFFNRYESGMNKELLDIYTDYLITQNQQATATGLSDVLDGELSHDQVTRFLSRDTYESKQLWEITKPMVREIETDDGVLCLDDSIAEKPYTDENDIICWHYSHAKGRLMKGINLLSCLIRYGDVALPVSFEIIKKEHRYIDDATNRERRKSIVTKNELFRGLIQQAVDNNVIFKYALADNWFSSKENMAFLHVDLKKYFIFGIKSNRTVATSAKDKLSGQFQQVRHLKLKEGQSIKVYLKGLDFPVQLLKKVFKNENGSTGVLYLVTNDLTIDANHMYQVYQKRWRIEEYHKSIKQNSSLAKSPTRTVRTQSNHVFASIVAYVKLEKLKLKTHLNHFAMRYKLVMKANRLAYKELQNMTAKLASELQSNVVYGTQFIRRLLSHSLNHFPSLGECHQ